MEQAINNEFYAHGCDFYSIEEIARVKHLHIHGYLYESDDHFAGVECSFAIVPLSKILAVKPSDRIDFVNDTMQEAPQYEVELKEDEVVPYFNTYYDGKAPKHLRYEDITEDTPCGHYAC